MHYQMYKMLPAFILYSIWIRTFCIGSYLPRLQKDFKLSVQGRLRMIPASFMYPQSLPFIGWPLSKPMAVSIAPPSASVHCDASPHWLAQSLPLNFLPIHLFLSDGEHSVSLQIKTSHHWEWFQVNKLEATVGQYLQYSPLLPVPASAKGSVIFTTIESFW